MPGWQHCAWNRHWHFDILEKNVADLKWGFYCAARCNKHYVYLCNGAYFSKWCSKESFGKLLPQLTLRTCIVRRDIWNETKITSFWLRMFGKDQMFVLLLISEFSVVDTNSECLNYITIPGPPMKLQQNGCFEFKWCLFCPEKIWVKWLANIYELDSRGRL